MTIALLIVAFASVFCFVIGCIRRFRQYANLPLHLRWELYPVPHESREKARYGGSYFEDSEWWTKARKSNRMGEAKVMADEIFAFNSVRESNPNLWWRTLCFHVGLYCLVAFVILEVASWLVLPGIERYAVAAGRVGLLLVLVGSIALLWRRLTDRNLRDYTHVADYIHLSAIVLTAALLLIGASSPSAPRPRDFLSAVISLNPSPTLPASLVAGLFLSFAVLAYIPYSHMSHFIAKYFTFHAIRWDDAPNSGDRFVGPISQNLQYRPTWWAAHMGADGAKTWADIATSDPTVAKEGQQ